MSSPSSTITRRTRALGAFSLLLLLVLFTAARTEVDAKTMSKRSSRHHHGGSNGQGGEGGGKSGKALITHYTPAGPSACKPHVDRGEMGVAVPEHFGQASCGKTIRYHIDGKEHQAQVVDFNTRSQLVLDLTIAQWQSTVPDRYDGVVPDVLFGTEE
ncbi:uncharacterized protein PSFLO_06587 [Pseudozyma flocculosa]|uniref:RlpA-like protein double-psi beta-barrel domain-containing protein n=1 Tax=Pseudozyma flocculosa TaxID=84751 RepID=A0A5C3FBU2_9BASI|nr:uncharacterized protein PSFLO_06587 [Pseudozyma flocculosa]